MDKKIKIKLILGDCLKALKKIEKNSVDLIFADPPYNLSGKNYRSVKNGRPVVNDKGDWDKIDDMMKFNKEWIQECIKVLSPKGTIWISGTLHNHPYVGVVLKELGLWTINDVIWYKPNATPLLSRNRLKPSTEMIWIASKDKKYFFNYDLAREINDGKQMPNLWIINAKRHITPHPTEKPEELIERIILLGSNKGNLVLDPFLGSGTTGVLAKKLRRNFIGIEIDKIYFKIAEKRIKSC